MTCHETWGHEVAFHGGAVVRFASVEEGAEVMRTADKFTSALSRFDLQSRLKTSENVTANDLLAFAAQQVESWSDDERKTVEAALESLRTKLEGFPPLFPERVLLIKTTGEEEGGAAYCRQNAIVLPRRHLAQPEGLERLLAHELFHILSRHDAARRDRLYAIVGFRPAA